MGGDKLVEDAREDYSPIGQALELEELDVDLYRSKNLWKPLYSRGVYGGQVMGLALKAAVNTVPEKFHVHSYHSYFLLAGDSSIPIVFHVRRVRDGKSYATRSIDGRQHGRSIFTMVASFHVPEQSSLVHQVPMPKVPPPEELKSVEQRLREWLKDPLVSKYHRSIQLRLEQPIHADTRPVPHKLLGLGPNDPVQMIWMKVKGPIPSNTAFHHCVAAFCSDHELLNTSLIPHGLAKYGEHRLLTMITSLDHAIWFHEPYRTDEWLLYVMESPKSNSGRGFATGRVYTRDGRLVISVAQEGVIRYTEKKQAML